MRSGPPDCHRQHYQQELELVAGLGVAVDLACCCAVEPLSHVSLTRSRIDYDDKQRVD